MKDLFDLEMNKFNLETELVNNEKDKDILVFLRNQREDALSPMAFRSRNTRGRIIPEDDSVIRGPFERDMGRIIFSNSFRRLRHKTQVFFNPVNDHICSRIEHVIYVNYISTTIGRALNLNIDLIQAIAMGHDIGHPPFGHKGETVLNKLISGVDSSLFFEHEVHGLRVVDILEEHGEDEKGLNLSFEVRDGISSHCGETYDEISLKPNRDKTPEDLLNRKPHDRGAPSTAEGCVVRFADKIAYVGRDVEDAIRAGIIDGTDFLPSDVVESLGNTNSEIINILVGDIIHSSLDSDEIRMSEQNFNAMSKFLKTNFAEIYKSPKIVTYEKTVEIMLSSLFETFMKLTTDITKAKKSSNPFIRAFYSFYVGHPEENCSDAQKVVDYIAGMTDSYANSCFDSLFKV